MILAAVYLIVFGWIIFKTPFFKDNQLSFLWIGVIFLLKILAAYGYYLVYFSNGKAQGDSADTLYGANIMFDAVHENVGDYVKMLFGIHTEYETDTLYKSYFEKINDWSDGKTANNFFLNDNRTSIRFNAFVRLFSGGSYAVHALVMLILSFIGKWAFYKTVKMYFINKEYLLAIIIFLTPSVLFWTSGVLKEPIALFLMGLFLYSFFKIFISKQFILKHVVVIVFSTLSFFTLKPYILMLLVLPLIIFYAVHCFQIKKVGLFYVLSLVLVLGVSIVVLKTLFNRDVIKTIVVRQNDFINLSNGGIFFANAENHLRLDCKDSLNYVFVNKEKGICKILPHTSLMYWKFDNPNDTIFVTDNKDTAMYNFLSSSLPAGSAIAMPRLEYSVQSFFKITPIAFYNVLAKPFFGNTKSAMELMASTENLFYLLFFMLCFWFRSKKTTNYNFLFLCISVVVLSFLLIGLTTTVGGAIVRYKVPFISFLLMIALLFLDENRLPALLKNKKTS